MGYNYANLKDSYDDSSFITLLEILQKSIGKLGLNNVELERTYKELYTQDSLGDVLNLFWFKRYKKKFEEENKEKEISLMVQRPDTPPRNNGHGPQMVKINNQYGQEDAKMEDEESAFDVDPVEPQYYGNKPSPVVSEAASVKQPGGLYQELIRLEQENQKQRGPPPSDKESERLIAQLVEEEKKLEQQERERKQREDEEGLLYAQQLQQQLEAEAAQKRQEEEEKNKPECKICFDSIEFDEINPLS